MTFKYKKIERPPPAGTTYAPYIPITLVGKKDSIDVMALLDSGADVSVIPKGIAEILGLDLEGEKAEVVGVGGKINSVETSVEVILPHPHEVSRFIMHVKVIIEDSEDNFPVLLGRRDFFTRFDITFKEGEKKVILKKSL